MKTQKWTQLNQLELRMQEILPETARIVNGESNVKLKYQFQELDWLTLEGWINYMEVLIGKTIRFQETH